ncbi:MAG: ribosome-binding factor A [Candidatus Marinimicrobia bacterium]|nr:ribosome-binding factor A [Candidatus Neomarinimicrobiota bacterium]RPG05967.1 MAG: 30S ribosome-binding factor RbfA [Pelagibacteraceae bacterium TMED247]|tara:strand:+ start:10216 stop:10608 length:393 start_codon:yes stop_codon:yes gene_type:complete
MIKNSSNFGPNHRKLRVGELIKQNLGQIFLKNEAKIPSFNTNLITITEVKMSSDLKSARAYVIPLGGKEIEKTVNTLTEFSYLVRKALSKKLDIKFLPKLHFVGDKSFDYAERIEKLIKQNNNEIKKRTY